MSDLDRIKHLAGILNEEMDKGDMHDALGDAMIAMNNANQSVKAVSDEIEKTLYAEESVEEATIQEEQPKMIKVKVINSGFKTDMGMKDAEIIGQEFDFMMRPVLRLRIKDVNMGDPVIADWKGDQWVVDMD